MEITISAEELELRCLELIDQVEAGESTVLITKNGRPIARMTPMPATVELLGSMCGTVVYEGDIISPIEGVWDLKEETESD